MAAVQSKQDSIMGMLHNVMERLDKLEKQGFPKAGCPETTSQSNPVVCHKRGQERHFARGCASHPKRKSVLPPAQAEMPLLWFGVQAYQWHSDHIYPGHRSGHHPAAQRPMGQVATIQEAVVAVGATPLRGSSWDLPRRLQFNSGGNHNCWGKFPQYSCGGNSTNCRGNSGTRFPQIQ